MENIFLKRSNIEESIREFTSKKLVLENLLKSKSYKYCDVIIQKNRKKYIGLGKSCGLYHFFYEDQNIKYSLYLGKGAFGKKGEWSLNKRLNHHFQEKQINTLPGKLVNEKIAKDNKDAINFLKNNNIYVQVLEIYFKVNNHMDWKLIDEIIKEYESFCIGVLNPKFTDR